VSGSAPDVVVPQRPGLHLLLDGPHGSGTSLPQRLAADAVRQDTPAIVVLLDEATPQFRAGLARRDVDVDRAEGDGLLQYVDAHAPRVGWAHTNPATVFAETGEVDALLLALSEAQSQIVEHAPEHRVIVSTVSTLLVLADLNDAYEFGQALASMAPRMGAVATGHVVPSMHDERETAALRHLADTVTDLRRDAEGAAARTRTATRDDDAR
jgi:KaiC/GvpD/RAD55 family RecA-like ATPase